MNPLTPPANNRYQHASGLLLGFHGCDRATGEAVLSGNVRHLSPSTNDYDWLGGGIYFWENDPQRALEFAQEASKHPKKSAGKIRDPFVVGAVIDLRLCLNFLERPALDELQLAYQFFKQTFRPNAKHKKFPANAGEDRGARFLDAAVIDMLHKMRAALNTQTHAFPAYDSVRGAFWEGGALYPGAGFEQKSHIQIAVRNPEACIKGYFRPLVESTT